MFCSDPDRCHLPAVQVWFKLDQSLDRLKDAAGCSSQQTTHCRLVQDQFVHSQSVHQSFEILQRADNGLLLILQHTHTHRFSNQRPRCPLMMS